MPTYDYECSKCKKGFEAFQSMKDDAFATCPKEKCQMKTWGKGKVKRLIGTGAGLLFKGSGFYITDYRSEGYKSAAKSDTPPAATPPTPAKTTESSNTSKNAEGGSSTPSSSGKSAKAAKK
jgi:putative FmdB family regulatory protein